MSYEQIAQIIFKEAKKAGYVVEERRSVSSNSMYYTLHGAKCSLLFRVSDHKTTSNVITLRIDHKSTSKTAESFVKNRIKDLGYRELKLSLGL